MKRLKLVQASLPGGLFGDREMCGELLVVGFNSGEALAGLSRKWQSCRIASMSIRATAPIPFQLIHNSKSLSTASIGFEPQEKREPQSVI